MPHHRPAAHHPALVPCEALQLRGRSREDASLRSPRQVWRQVRALRRLPDARPVLGPVAGRVTQLDAREGQLVRCEPHVRTPIPTPRPLLSIHRVQHYFKGPGAAAFLERITPASASTLADNTSTLSTLLHPHTGGIVDDTIITKLPGDVFFVVTNAACRDKDSAYLSGELDSFKAEHGEDGNTAVTWDRLDGRGLIAIQGPAAVDIFSATLPAESRDLSNLYFGQSRSLSFKLPTGETVSDVLVSRGGYTGEDGFEISVPGEHTTALAQLLLETGGPDKLRWAGLGARDSLRLEAGMCLYGHDLDDTTTPVEGALSWIIPKDRREKGGFHGADAILAQLKPKSKGGAGVDRRRVGFVVDGAPAREGAEIVDETGASIGKITSGCPSPTLKKNIAMGYIKDGKHKSGTEVQIVVRGRPRKAVVTKMPFVPSKYWKGGASPA